MTVTVIIIILLLFYSPYLLLFFINQEVIPQSIDIAAPFPFLPSFLLQSFLFTPACCLHQNKAVVGEAAKTRSCCLVSLCPNVRGKENKPLT